MLKLLFSSIFKFQSSVLVTKTIVLNRKTTPLNNESAMMIGE